MERHDHHHIPQKGRQERVHGNYRCISLISHSGKVFLEGVARRFGDYCEANVHDNCEAKELLPEEQCGLRPDRPTTDIMLVVRRLQETGRKTGMYILHYL